MRKSSKVLRVGTRSSKLALAQVQEALDAFKTILPSTAFDVVPFSSPGDRDRFTDLRTAADDFFTAELDQALLAGKLDFAVHSAKDVPDPVPEGLDWFSLPTRFDLRDVIVLRRNETVVSLPAKPVIGVSSDRRETYCRRRFPTAQISSVRGNIDERLAQLDSGVFDILVMAAAALQRLNLENHITEWISLADLPVPDGQGSLAITFRADDERFLRLRNAFVYSVVFAGAGAGRAGLCAVEAIQALQRCDICFYDALLDQELLKHLPPNAEAVDAGKRSGGEGATQPQITDLITRCARMGRRVVRLKAGDPGIFGRITEETAALDSLCLPYRIIPGISSLIVATTGSGMFLTRRDVSRGFCVITPRKSKSGSVPITADERAKLPVIFFMARDVAKEVTRQLLDEGRPAKTHATMVFDAGGADELIVRGQLDNISNLIAAADADTPGLLIVGEIAGYELSRQWGALQGRRVLITCSADLQEKSAALISDLGGTSIRLPLIRIIRCREALEHIRMANHFDWFVITSPASVRTLMELMAEAGADIRRIPGIMVSGPQTAAELERHLIKADVVPTADFGSKGLLATAGQHIKAGSRVLRLASDRSGSDITDGLRALGALVTDCTLYRNEVIKHARLPAFDDAMFLSASAVDSFIFQWGSDVLTDKTVVAIGEPTALALRKRNAKVDVSPHEASIPSSIRALALFRVRKAMEEIV